MCGIAGVIAGGAAARAGDRVSVSGALDRMVHCMHHRGPDDRGVEIIQREDVTVGLGHTRLSILDLSAAGHQPMQDVSGRLRITYNGEIYNYLELRRELQSVQEEWGSQTDTEVILNAYKHWGVQAFRRFRGMFAFALWDDRSKELLLVRDHFGIKPLYFNQAGNRVVFASEIRTLLASDLVSREMDPEGLRSFLRFGAIESPLTIIQDIKCLPPGRYLSIRCNGRSLKIDERGYCEDLLSQGRESRPRERPEAVDALRNKLEESVRIHLVSDVPVAAFLSGGIDSSAIVALMSHVTRERPRTFTVTFAEKEFSEQGYSRLIAETYGTQHSEVMLSEDTLLSMLPAALAAMDQPTIDGVNSYVISSAVKQAGIKVALSGLGGDELFAGYPSFRRVERLRRLAVIPGYLREATAKAGRTLFGSSVQQRKAWYFLAGGGTAQSAYTVSRQLFSWEEIGALLRNNGSRREIPATGGVATGYATDDDRLNEVSRYELQGYMANILLRDTDQMSMAHSLEVRVPFVDSAVIPYVLGLPGKWKVDPQRTKPLLLDAVADLIPRQIWQRPKMGFTLPFERWMRSTLRPELAEAFSPSDGLKRLGLTDYCQKVWGTFERDSRKERWSRPWALYVIKKWCEIHGVST